MLAQTATVDLILGCGHSGMGSAVREAIWEAFHAEGLEIPYTQLVLHQA